MEYKQIVNYPLYYINSEGNSVIKLCRVDLYKKIGDDFFRRRSTHQKFDTLLPRDKFIEIDGLVYRILKIAENQFGYKFVKLSNYSGKHTLYVHQLMYRTFVGAIPSNMEINHIDHNKQNNSLDNLELVTREDNMRKAVLFYGNKLKPRCKQCGKVISENNKTGYCMKCLKEHGYKNPNYKKDYKYEHPSKDVLWKLIKAKSFLEIGRIYGVTDNAIRKLAKQYGLPFRRRDIERQIEEEKNSLLESHCIGES